MLFMVPLGPPGARPMAQALRLPFEYLLLAVIVFEMVGLAPHLSQQCAVPCTYIVVTYNIKLSLFPNCVILYCTLWYYIV